MATRGPCVVPSRVHDTERPPASSSARARPEPMTVVPAGHRRNDHLGSSAVCKGGFVAPNGAAHRTTAEAVEDAGRRGARMPRGAEQDIQRLTVRSAARPGRCPFVGATAGR